MIQSMTGYGKSETVVGGKKIHAEIKSLNSKSLDLSTRIAPLYREKEMEIRRLIAQHLERGKVDFTLWVEKVSDQSAPSLNEEVVAGYVGQMKRISEAQGIGMPPMEGLWDVIVRLPDVTLSQTVEELTDEEWTAVRAAVEESIDHLVEFRKQEGEALFRKFSEKVDNIERLLSEIEPFETSRVAKIRMRLEERLAELKGVDFDKNRLEQELIYYIEKLDISEEKQRLTNHLRYFRETMANGHAQGKKTGIHRAGDGSRDQHDGLEEQSSRDAEHRREDEGRTRADQGTGAQCALSLSMRP